MRGDWLIARTFAFLGGIAFAVAIPFPRWSSVAVTGFLYGVTGFYLAYCYRRRREADPDPDNWADAPTGMLYDIDPDDGVDPGDAVFEDLTEDYGRKENEDE